MMKAYLADRATPPARHHGALENAMRDHSLPPRQPAGSALDHDHYQVEHHAAFDGWTLIRYGPTDPHGALVARLEDEAEGRRIAATLNREAGA